MTHAKLVHKPFDCDGILPPHGVTKAVGANAYAGTPVANQCHLVWETPDLSRIGQLFISFDLPPHSGPANISDFEGNTLIENERSKETCVFALAINTDPARSDLGWLIISVFTENSIPPPCPLAREFIETAFDNLEDVA